MWWMVSTGSSSNVVAAAVAISVVVYFVLYFGGFYGVFSFSFALGKRNKKHKEKLKGAGRAERAAATGRLPLIGHCTLRVSLSWGAGKRENREMDERNYGDGNSPPPTRCARSAHNHRRRHHFISF
jgi:hypothetical protein